MYTWFPPRQVSGDSTERKGLQDHLSQTRQRLFRSWAISARTTPYLIRVTELLPQVRVLKVCDAMARPLCSSQPTRDARGVLGRQLNKASPVAASNVPEPLVLAPDLARRPGLMGNHASETAARHRGRGDRPGLAGRSIWKLFTF